MAILVRMQMLEIHRSTRYQRTVLPHKLHSDNVEYEHRGGSWGYRCRENPGESCFTEVQPSALRQMPPRAHINVVELSTALPQSTVTMPPRLLHVLSQTVRYPKWWRLPPTRGAPHTGGAKEEGGKLNPGPRQSGSLQRKPLPPHFRPSFLSSLSRKISNH